MAGRRAPPVRVAVNLFARQFNQEDLTEKIVAVLEETGLDALNLELELTESWIMKYTRKSVARLNELKMTSGIKLAIDDFGTGYSSLSYLKRFPLDILKIDQSFVRDIATDLVATIYLAHNLDLCIIAKGVETEEQLDYLRDKGRDEIQGHFSKPCDAEEFAALLRNGQKLL